MLRKKRKEEIEEGILYGEMEEKAVKNSLKNSIKDGVAASVASSVGDNFISAYAISLNASNIELGLLSALPNIMPGELFSAKVMEKVRRKSIVTTGVLLQALLWLPMALVSVLFLKDFRTAPLMLIVFYSIYTFVSFFINPAWSSWMKDLTDGKIIGEYFGKRNRIAGIAGLTATILAGLLLDYFKNREMLFIGFGILFVTAAISKLVSRKYLRGQYEPRLKLEKGYYFTFWQFMKKAPYNNYGRFAIFFAAMNFATAISGPFFAAYMLKDLHLNYIAFTLIQLVIPTVATLILMPLWGDFTDRYGNVKTLQLTALLVPIVPILWIVSPSLYWIVFIQIFSGIVWAGFNLSASNFTYDAVTRPRMALCVAYSGFLASSGVFLGAIVGGLLASFTTISMNIYLFVFVISGLARLAFAITLSPGIKEVRQKVDSIRLLPIWKPLHLQSFQARRIEELVELPYHLFLQGKKKR